MFSPTWYALTAVLSAVLRFCCSSTARSRAASPAQPNPHAFGTAEWREHEGRQATRAERAALRIADLEAQVNQTGELAEALERVVATQDTIIGGLRRENARLRAGPDPDVLQRLLDDIHAPVKRPAQVATVESHKLSDPVGNGGR